MSETPLPFGKYILLEKLATGGMAEVYLAKNPGIGISKFVAIKRILPQFSENENFIEMFKGEAKIAINLAHSNIVTIHEFGVERDQFFIVMDFVEGRNLRQILNKLKKTDGALSVEQTTFIIREVAAGIDHAHRCLNGSTGKPLNIIHRDMSPQNVMVSFEGEVKVVDFGIAKAETQIETTRLGELKGKFGYMSPEQADGQPVDLRTDIFSLGIVLWELLANDRLFIANNEVNTLRKIRECHVPSLRKINPNVPPELERIVSMALAKDRNLRYQTAATLHRELSRFLNRQYPDFSSHDFSTFIKSLFASEMLDARKRQIEYSTIDARPVPSRPDQTVANIKSPLPAAAVAAIANGARPMPMPMPKPGPAQIKQDPQRDSGSLTGTENDELTPTPAPPRKPSPPLKAPVPVAPAPAVMDKSVAKNAGKQIKLSLEADSDSWSARQVPREQTSTPQAYAFETSSYNPYLSRPRSKRLSQLARAIVRSATGPVIATVAGLAIWYAVDPQGFREKTGTTLAAIERLTSSHNSKSVAFGRSAESSSDPSLRVTSIPSGASIWIDDKPWADSTPAAIDLPEGPHAIRIQNAGYRVWTQNVDLRKQGLQINAQLTRDKIAYLSVATDVFADIYVDGQPVSSRATEVTDLQVDADRPHLIRVVSVDNPASSLERSISIAEKRAQRVSFSFAHARRTPSTSSAPRKKSNR